MPSLLQGLSWEAVEQFSAQNNEPDWLREKRRTGWDAFLSMPTPDWTRGIRGWWSSALKPLDFEELTPFSAAGTGSLPAITIRRSTARMLPPWRLNAQWLARTASSAGSLRTWAATLPV